MSHKVNLVRVLTSATGNSTPITLGSAYSQLFMTPAEAGAMNGRTYTYLIVDGNDWEMGKGVYTASGTTLARTTILASRIAGTLGTSKITLSGTAQVRFIESAEDMDGVRGTRAVTGTSDTLANSDLGFVVTYSNASAIAVSLAQASVSNLFTDGWATWVQNLGAGTVTITPATSTVNGGSTLVLAQNLGAFIWSDGTNYHAYFMPVTKPLLAANALAELAGVAATARTNIYAAPFDALAFNGMQINGDFAVSQELGATAAVITASATHQTKRIADCWKTEYHGSFVATTQITDVRSFTGNAFPGFINALNVSVTTAQTTLGSDDYFSITTPIEGTRCGRLSFGFSQATPLTIGFLFFSAVGATYSGSIRNGAGTRSYPFSFVAAANAATYQTVTVPGDVTGTWAVDNTTGLFFSVCMAAGTNFTGPANAWASSNLVGANGTSNGVSSTSQGFYITGVVVLPGIELPTAARAPFIMRPYDQELLICKRYYEVISPNAHMFSGNVTSGSNYHKGTPFQVQKRATPTMTGTNAFNSNFSTTVGTFQSDTNGVYEMRTATATGAGIWQTTVTADARL